MIHFPIAIVDDFLGNPNMFRDFALKQEFNKSKFGNFPGKRTRPLHELNVDMYNYINAKIISMYYNLSKEDVSWSNVATFDIMKPYTDDGDVEKNRGWIHQDGKHSMVGVLYLSTNEDVGTCFYNKKDNYEIPQEYIDYKEAYYLDQNNIEKSNNYFESKKIHNNNFVETVKVKSVYNRLICYDAKMYHAYDDMSKITNDRLTFNFFFNEIDVDKTPLERVYSYDKRKRN
tara:strand:+ start:1768 stop:2457 length:690 start_codon:yes stop_codon:yes gene_type:complete